MYRCLGGCAGRHARPITDIMKLFSLRWVVPVAGGCGSDRACCKSEGGRNVSGIGGCHDADTREPWRQSGGVLAEFPR